MLRFALVLVICPVLVSFSPAINTYASTTNEEISTEIEEASLQPIEPLVVTPFAIPPSEMGTAYKLIHTSVGNNSIGNFITYYSSQVAVGLGLLKLHPVAAVFAAPLSQYILSKPKTTYAKTFIFVKVSNGRQYVQGIVNTYSDKAMTKSTGSKVTNWSTPYK